MSKVTPAIQAASNSEVVAIASRDIDSASAAAAKLGISDAYGTYEGLLAADNVDAVYIPLPNDMHAQWVLEAAQAGKHILCEKPLAMSQDQASEMMLVCAEAGVKLQEAFMYRHHPTWVESVRLLRSGAIGDLLAVQSWFSYSNDDPTNIRNRLENGGGAVMDIGCYNINLSRMLFDAEPTSIASIVYRDPTMRIDTMTSAVLEFPGGGQSSFTCSMRSEEYQRVHIFGTHGRIDIEVPFNIPTDRETRVYLSRGGDPPVDPATKTIVFPKVNQYTIQAELFADAILNNSDVAVSPSDAVANMAVIEAVLSS
jgi:predicted dehydrogenase